MASKIDVSGLTLNAQEALELASFIAEKVFAKPALNSIHAVQTGIQMKQQIGFAGRLGKTGVLSAGDCSMPTSGATLAMNQKYWDPAKIVDLLTHCNEDLNGKFKPYFGKVNSFRELFEVQGTDLAMFLAMRIMESIDETLMRAVWLGDSAVPTAGAAAEGLKVAGNSKFYDYFDGLWKQIFAAVTAGDVERVTITENTAATNALRTTLAAGRSVEIFDAMITKADSRLRGSADQKLLVSREIFDNYKKYLRTVGENYTIQYTTDGFPSLMFEGIPVVNMENVWDRDLRADFVEDTTDNLFWLPNRAVLTVPANIPVGTLNENDMAQLKSWFSDDDNVNKVLYGFTLDAKLLEEYMIVTAY